LTYLVSLRSLRRMQERFGMRDMSHAYQAAESVSLQDTENRASFKQSSGRQLLLSTINTDRDFRDAT